MALSVVETPTDEPEEETPLRFLDLPPELRNMIYQFTIPSNPIKVRSQDHIDNTKYIKTTFHFPASPLLQISQQIRTEASDLYYTTATFQLTTSYLYLRFATEIGPGFGPATAKLPLLRKIQVVFAETVFMVDRDNTPSHVLHFHDEVKCSFCKRNVASNRQRCAIASESCMQRLRKIVDEGLAERGGEEGLRKGDVVEVLR